MLEDRSAPQRRLRLSLLISCAFLASCALGPKVPQPNLALPAAYDAAPPGEAPAGALAEASIDRWWTLYDDPQLEALVEESLTDAPDARSALARLREALADRAQALSDFKPKGSIQASGSRVGTTELAGPPPFNFGGETISLVNAGVVDSYSANFDVSWELDLFGRSFITRRKANADLAAARFDYEASRTSLAATVADQLFQVRGLAIQLDDARQAARIARGLADIAAAKARHGLGGGADSAQAASDAAQAEAQAADLKTQLKAAQRTLLVLVGHGADALDSLPAQPSVGAPPPIPASVPGRLLARRPDVREAAMRLLSAKGTLKLDELALFPTFTLQPGLGLSDTPILGQASVADSWTLGLALAQPILDIPRLKAEIRAQGARADQDVIAYEKAVQTAFGEADSALMQLGSDEARVRTLTAGEAQALSAYEAEQKAYAAGIDDLTSVLTAERTWRSARTALTGAKVAALRRSVQTFKALGGGWSDAELAAAETRARKGAGPAAATNIAR
ncbi:MAG: TolC family protein [Caulobacteraceae bacterium]|nr:TolC family protein [Caulobacteraceae bacterium]